jgi:hypothetical protein
MSHSPKAAPTSLRQGDRITTTTDVLDAALASLNVTNITTSQLVDATNVEERKRIDENLRERMYFLTRT